MARPSSSRSTTCSEALATGHTVALLFIHACMYERAVRRTAEDTAATRAALVDAALFAFARDGIDRATLAGIAEAAGVTRGAVYHHFADKDALLAAVLGE